SLPTSWIGVDLTKAVMTTNIILGMKKHRVFTPSLRLVRTTVVATITQSPNSRISWRFSIQHSSSLLSTSLSFLIPTSGRAGSATWNLNPMSGDWNTAANWTPATVPNSPADTASYTGGDG